MLKYLAPILLLPALSVAHAAPVPLLIGGTTIQFPIDAGYVRVSQEQPKFFELTAAALPPSNKLVESFFTRADITRLGQGGIAADTYFQVQVVRTIESRQISLDDWDALKPELTAGMAKLDMNQALSSVSGSNDRMSAVAGQQVKVSFGKIGAAVIYRETPLSVNFGMLVPVQMSVGDNAQNSTIAVAGADAMVHNKVIFIYAYSTSTSAEAIAKLRARLDATVDQTIALNPSDATMQSSLGFNWSRVWRSALIGGVLGGIGGLFGWFIRRRKVPPKT